MGFPLPGSLRSVFSDDEQRVLLADEVRDWNMVSSCFPTLSSDVQKYINI